MVPLKGRLQVLCLLPEASLDVLRGTQDTKGQPFQKAQRLGIPSVPSMHLGCSMLHIKDKLAAKRMEREKQILS